MSTDSATTKPDGGASASTAELGGFSDLAKALSGMIEMEVLIQQLMALGVEYQLGNISPARFAARTHELLVAYQRGAEKTPNV